MKLIIAIVSSEDSNRVMKHLVKYKYFVTKMATSGGFLKSGNSTLMIGANDEQVEDIIDIISRHSKSRTEIIPNSVVSEYGGIMPIYEDLNENGTAIIGCSIFLCKKIIFM